MTTTDHPSYGPPAPLRTTWREKSRSDRDVVMEELDAFGVLTGRTHVNSIDPAPSSLRTPDAVISPWMPSDPTPHIIRPRASFLRIFAVALPTAIVVELVARIVT